MLASDELIHFLGIIGKIDGRDGRISTDNRGFNVFGLMLADPEGVGDNQE